MGDHAVSLAFDNGIQDAQHQRILQGHVWLQQQRNTWILDIIPAYTSITIVYDPILLRKMGVDPLSACYDLLKNMWQHVLHEPALQTTPAIREVPVCYHSSLAPDLEAVAHQHKLSIDDLIHIHSKTTYRVYMNGFLPGFAYMGILDERIATPRLSNPRTQVPAGSVGIAGQQTGIYPVASPGGWNIIGRTPLALLRPDQEQPCVLEPGNIVQFKPIDLHHFHNWSAL